MSDVDWATVPGAVVTPEQVTPMSRIISGAAFLELWTADEVAAAEEADPRLRYASRKAIAQNSVNLDSPELAQLLALAVAKGALTQDRAAQIMAGQTP